ncbi:MAG: trehalose 6-phosphate synthase [Candidatus Woesearchaeota archaeon]
MTGIRYLEEFYKEMRRTATLKRKIIALMFDDKTPSERQIKKLEESLDRLEKIPRRHDKHVLLSKEGKKINSDLSYEKTELQKDIVFLRDGEEGLMKHFRQQHKNFDKEVKRVTRFLGKDKINSFITDRDGTINNYCGRYMSSIQSVYNAFFISSFAMERTRKSLIITSAPLKGILEMSVAPKRSFIYAGSKGREYQTRLGKITGMKIEKRKQKLLNTIEKEIIRTLKNPDNSKFYYIGSGFQKKFGQITIARQDINHSVPRKESENFLKMIKEIVEENDPDQLLQIEDTGLDIELILNHGGKAFSKGDGVEYLSRHMRLNLEDGKNLVCGDTESDISMASKAASLNKYTRSIFVTEDEKLKRKASKELSNICFVKSPDILVTSLYRSSKNE